MKKMPYGEADFLVRILSKDFGKIDCLAKGARKSDAKLNSHLDMINFIRISFVQNGERLPTLIDAEIIERFDDWFSDAEHIGSAGKILKLVDAVVPAASPDFSLFSLIISFFQSIPNTTEIFLYEQIFITKFLEHEGYASSLLPPEVTDAIMKLWPNWKI